MLPHVTAADVSKEKQTVTISMDKHITLSAFQNALDKKFTITAIGHNETAEQAKSWLTTYMPLLLIFGYITTIAIIAAVQQHYFNWMEGMRVFMAGFFLSFSFFKMLDLKGFAESYAMYDMVAKKWNDWGYVYAFIELLLGLAFLTGIQPFVTNMVAVIVMVVSIVGVLKAVLNKQKIRCACLGAVFNLPMSTVTIIEDALMIGMSGIMILTLL